MLRVLIVEDSADKLRRIYQCFTSEPGVTPDNIEHCVDVNTAKLRLTNRKFDLLIIDISIPTRPDRLASTDGGIQLLEEIVERECYLVPDHIVGLTAYAELQAAALRVFEPQNWSVIHYLPESEEWEDQLRNKVAHILSAERSEGRADVEFQSDLAIICALNTPELSSVRQLPWSWELSRRPWDHTNYIRGHFERNGRTAVVHAAAAPRMGMTATAVLATKMIVGFRPRYLAMVGIAAGIRDRVNLGDIVVVDSSFDYGSGKFAKNSGHSRFLLDPHHVQLAAELRSKFSLMAEDDQWLHSIRKEWPADKPAHELRLHIGPLASGAAVLADAEMTIRVVDQHRKLLGVDMEAYGLMAAAEEASAPRPQAFVVKSICDFADEEKDDSLQRYDAYTSSQALARFAVAYL